MARKTDRRTIYTTKLIKDACYEALQKKPIDQITVTQLCKAAEINRSTFYLHYMDARAVYEEMLDEVIAAIEPEGRKVFSADDINWNFSHEIYRGIMHDERMVFLLHSGMTYEPFLKKFANCEAEWAMEFYRTRSKLPEDDLRVVLSSLFYSYFVSDRYYLETHTIKELERCNELMNQYIIQSVHEKLISE